jgi:hypothetical protein
MRGLSARSGDPQGEAGAESQSPIDARRRGDQGQATGACIT